MWASTPTNIIRIRIGASGFAGAYCRADRGVRPYKMFYGFADGSCNFAGASCAGGVEPLPYGNCGRLYGFALACSDLRHCAAQSFRHGYAVPPPFTQGRRWMVQTRRRTASPRCRARQAPPLRYDETRDCSKIRTFPLISRLRRQLPPEGKPWNFAKTQGQKFMSYAQNVIASNICHLF